MARGDTAENLLSRNDTALVIVDIQERLMPSIANHETLLANVLRLIRFARILNLPILASQQIKLGPLVSEIASELPDLEVTTKAEFGALKCPEFSQRVDASGRNTLIVVGMEAHICVAQTVLHAVPRYRVHVISDAVGSRTEDNWRVGIERMRQTGAIISSTEMLMYELMERAGTDEFRAVLPIVKGT
ncbi:MAG: isochorismatase family protein [Chloroflexota bacterium]|nr:MAG: isochorismatase family protein [Chloroflexota bacterium]